MFSKRSRYKKLPGVVTRDARGRSLVSKSMRSLPRVSGTFLHTVEEGDRPDHLAFKYYKQQRKWWRICDANPEFMSPQALLGKDPILITRFFVTYNHNMGNPPWFKLIKRLSRETGVKDVALEENIELVKTTTVNNDSQPVEVHYENFKPVVVVTYNILNLNAGDLKSLIKDEEFEVIELEHISRMGKKIVIPPNIVE